MLNHQTDLVTVHMKLVPVLEFTITETVMHLAEEISRAAEITG